ncbi:ParA family protein [Alloscardovia venturai]|uniref:ParA family protein n=1 Tax=Alloscardovia venturai TaxID=1769421 RepID=A0ABW2YBX8_9BIFI
MKIVIANAKGGVGKTTSALYLAAAARMRGLKASVWDADPQASASLWADKATELGEPLPFDVIPANRSTLTKPTEVDELVFVDTPPSGDTMLQAIAYADMVIVPMSDSPMEFMQTWQVMSNIQTSIQARVLLVRAEEHTTAFKELETALAEQRIPRFTAVVKKRQPLKLAVGTNPHKLYEYGDVLSELIAHTPIAGGTHHGQ